MLNLRSIRRRLGHEHRRIRLLKIDCEGCEWDSLFDEATSGPSMLRDVDELYLELHLDRSATGKLDSEEEIAKFATVYDLLFRRERFRTWFSHVGTLTSRRSDFHPRLVEDGQLMDMLTTVEVGLVREERRQGAQGTLELQRSEGGVRVKKAKC
eukprot:5076504-Prymnesium_polylepis.1